MLILMVDDFHNIHTNRVPDLCTTSSAVHMATILCQKLPDIPALPKYEEIHQPVMVQNHLTCRGGINEERVAQALKQFLATHAVEPLSTTLNVQPSYSITTATLDELRWVHTY